MKLYLDVSCLNRPYDDQRQSRVRPETEAIALIFEAFKANRWQHISSEMSEIEISKIVDEERRHRVELLLPPKAVIFELNDRVLERGGDIVRLGFGAADATHAAAAEFLKLDAFLSCDDKLCRTARRHRRALRVHVANPLEWIKDHDPNAE